MKSRMNNLFKFDLVKSRPSADSLDEFKQHYLNSNSFVRKVIAAHIRSNDRDDLVQEVYLKAWKGFSQFKKEAQFNTWIYTITMRVIWDFLKTQKFSEELSENILGQSTISENRIVILQGLSKLELQEREYFVLYYNLGYSFKELAELVQKPESTVKSIVYKAKEKFITWMRKNGGLNE